MVGPPTEHEIYIECVLSGGLLKVNAIDARTGTEVSVFGPTNAREALTRNAVAKLAYVMKKANSE
jgi:hypothetical protein